MKLRASLLFAMILSVSSKRIKRKSKTGEAGGLRNDQRLTPIFPDNFGTRCRSDKDCASGLLLVCDTYRCRSGDAPSFPDNFGTRCSSDKDCASDLLVCDVKNHCRSGDGGSCELHKHCGPGLSCSKDGICEFKSVPEADCSSDEECMEGATTVRVCDHDKGDRCFSGYGGVCTHDKQCASGLVCVDEERHGDEKLAFCNRKIVGNNHCDTDKDCYEGENLDNMVCFWNQCTLTESDLELMGSATGSATGAPGTFE